MSEGAKDPTGKPLCSKRRQQSWCLIVIGFLWGSYAIHLEYTQALMWSVMLIAAGAGKYTFDRIKTG